MAVASTGAASAQEGSSPTGFQSLTIPSELATAAPIESPSIANPGQGFVQRDGELFAINLESTLLPTDPSSAVVRSGFEGLRLYVTRFEKDGQIWHRLRMGFFRSEENARRALAALHSEYPEAWIARTTAKEVSFSAEVAIYEPTSFTDLPGLSAETTPNPSSEAPGVVGSYLNITIPEIFADTRITVSTPEGKRGEPETGPQVALESSVLTPQSNDTFRRDSFGSASPGFGFRDSRYQASSEELALLQRWDPGSENLKKSSSGFAFEGQDGLVGYSVGFEGEGSVKRPGFEAPLNAANEWNQSLAVRGDLSWSRLANLQFKNQLIEQRDEEEQYIGDFLIGREPDTWRQNRISSTALTMGLLEDRLTSYTVLNTSRYTDSDLDDEYVVGYHLFQRMDLDVWRGEDTRLSVFGAYGEVDKDYNDFALEEDDKKKKKNPFSDPGQAGTKYGATFGLGPADLTLAQADSWDSGDSNGSHKTQYEASLGLDLNRFRGLLGDVLGESFWNIAPDYAYASYGFGAVDVGPGSETEDRTTDISAGANWNWGSGYSYLGYWHSYYDNRQPGSEDYDWAGDGLDLGGGIWGNRWNFDLSFYMSRSDQMGEWSEASDLSVGGGLSLGYKPDELPDLKVSLSSDHYRGDYIASNGTSENASWVFTSELDFTKYWEELWGPRQSNLGMVFQLRDDSSSEKWGGESEDDSNTEFFVGLKMSVGLGE
jgi:hypothetical protein